MKRETLMLLAVFAGSAPLFAHSAIAAFRASERRRDIVDIVAGVLFAFIAIGNTASALVLLAFGK